jgi:hypothetical protein
LAIIKCKECAAEISTQAKACPKCGAKQPKKTSMFTWIVGGLFTLGVISAVVGAGESRKVATSDQASKVATNAAQLPLRKPGAAVAALVKEADKVEGITWYRDRNSPQHANVNGVFAYIGDKNNRAWLRFRIQYAGDDWLFVKKAIFIADGTRLEATGNWERDNKSTVWEWFDVSADADTAQLIRSIAQAKDVTMRLEGQQYHRDRKLSGSEQKALRNVLSAYAELGGI